MKPTSIAFACFVVAMCSPAFAGEPASAPAPTTSYDTYEACGWFIGGGGEYLFDSEEDYWNGHIGYNFSDASALFLEVGWLGNESDDYAGLPSLETDLDIVPITLNYKYELSISERFGWYIGAGLGAAYVDAWLDSAPTGPASDDEWSFTFQAFTGLVYEFTPSFEMYLGLRYLWVDDFELAGQNLETSDDLSLGLGLRFNF